MKIVSWNVNSIKARMTHVQDYLAQTQPDVLMVQELKGLEFPQGEFAGYHTHAVPQKAYNGVAIFSKTPVTVILEQLPGDTTDEQARYIEFETSGMRMINIYAPNGNPVGTEKYTYKLAWMARLYNRLKMLRDEGIPFLIGGDFNVIPEDRDCYDPKAWKDDALFTPETRRAFRSLENIGLYDAFRIFDFKGGQYTFWDYQRGAWQNDHGIRIDHFLLSPMMADKAISCDIDRGPRGLEKPSDHTPIVLSLAA